MKRSPGSEATAAATIVKPPLEPGDVVEIDCTDLIAKTGQAVGRADGMVLYVLGPVPGERAKVRVETVKAKYAVGELIELLTTSPDRAEPFCAYFGTCGGCQVQHLAYAAQLRWKRDIVLNALRRIGGVAEPDVRPTIGMEHPRGYRNKMALVVDRSGPSAAFGFYAARTHDVVPIEACPVVMPRLDGDLAGLWAAALDPESAPAFDEARHVIARAAQSSGQGVLSITTERASRTLHAAAPALAAHLPDVVGITNSFEPPSENAVLGRRHTTVCGRAEMEEQIGDVRFRVSPASFFQVNGEMVGRIYAYLGERVKPAPRFVDLYCGAGTFALYFAKRGAEVVGVEENPNAVREARVNAGLNGVAAQTTFVIGRVDATLRSQRGRQTLAQADVVFLDPPRKGSDQGTLEALRAALVPEIWYLSCNPATLARDLAFLIAGGYRLGSVQPFDMFPQTGHIEALAVLHAPSAAGNGAALGD